MAIDLSGFGDDSDSWDPTQWGAGGTDFTTGVTGNNGYAMPGLQGQLQPGDYLGSGNLGSTQTVNPDGSLASGLPSGTDASGLGGGSTITQALAKLGQPGNTANLSSILGSLSKGIQNNRVIQGNFTQKYDQQALADQTGRNQTESDALKKLAQTSYLMSGGSKFTPPSLTLNGKTYAPSNLGYGPAPASAAQQSGAASLQAQLGSRLAPGGTVSPSPLSDYATPGTGENLASGLAAGLGGLGALGLGLGGSTQVGANGQAGSTSALGQGLGAAGAAAGLAKGLGGASGSNLGGILGAGTGSATGSLAGDLIPGLGAAAGIYGMSQNKGALSDILSGAGTGASLGSIIPGLGTLIGGGLGAAAGGIESLFNIGKPNATVTSGRQAESQIENSFGGFQGLMNAVGPAYQATGHTADQAQADVKSMLDAENSGPQAVAQAWAKIQSMMGK